MCSLLVTVAAAGAVLVGPGPWAGRGAAPGLDELAFLVGAWEREDGGESMREVWDPVRGDAMVGHFSIVKEGHATLYELLAIEAGGGEPAMRLRHFGPGLMPWETEAAGPLTFSLVEAGEERAVFEDPARDFPRRLIYTVEGDELTIRFEPAPGSERAEVSLVFARPADD